MNKFRYSLLTKAKKEICPECRKKTYVRFVDLSNGNIIPEKYGRCDREDRCGYFLSPYQDGYAKENIDPDFKPSSIVIEEKPISFIDREVAVKTMLIDINNNLFNFLTNKLDREKTANTFTDYRVGFKNNWCIFWQCDINGKYRSGKYMRYTPEGRRDKSSITTWEHARKNINGYVYPTFNLKQCFFGEHLLANDQRKPVAIVESEKTALIASIFYDSYIWLACGSKNGLSEYKCEVLKDRKVMLYPDLGAYSEWYEKAVKHGFGISRILEDKATEYDRENGLDLADFLLR